MNRDDLLKRCVDRRVAHETSVVAVSHLFYVYLLSALKKGQRVEVPNFGTFGTHIVGVKRQRRMPFFEVENDLADKVNERFRNLKTLLVARYELNPVEGEVEYEGKAAPRDPVQDNLGKEILFDTYRDINADEFRQQEQGIQHPPLQTQSLPSTAPSTPQEESRGYEPVLPPREKKLMPKLNLRGEGMETPPTPGPEPEPVQPPEPPPTLRDISGGGSPSPVFQILIGLIILGAITFALNHFGIIHLWGKKAEPAQSVEENLPPSVQPSPQTEDTQTETPLQHPGITEEGQKSPSEPQQTPSQLPSEADRKQSVPKTQTTPAQSPPSLAAGDYTIQVSSLNSRREANKIMQRLSAQGFNVYISEAMVKGRKWFRVRVGKYENMSDAQASVQKLKAVNENGVWVARVE